MAYAEKTKVDAFRTRVEIEKLVTKYGAVRFGTMSSPDGASVAFEYEGWRVRFTLPLPKLDDVSRLKGARSGKTAAQNKLEQLHRSRWRSLFLAIKAKLDSVESGIETFEEAFMAHIALPNGQTMGQWGLPQVHDAYVAGNMPPLLKESNP